MVYCKSLSAAQSGSEARSLFEGRRSDADQSVVRPLQHYKVGHFLLLQIFCCELVLAAGVLLLFTVLARLCQKLCQPSLATKSRGLGKEAVAVMSFSQRVSPAKCFTFSWADAPPGWEPLLEESFGAVPAKGWIAAPSQPCPHTQKSCLQGFVSFTKKVRKTALKMPSGMTLEISPAATKHATKRFSGKHSVAKGCCLQDALLDAAELPANSLPSSVCPKIVLRAWQEEIVAILTKEPDDRVIHWIWEPLGCTGKTTFQKWLFHQFAGTVVLSGKAVDMKHNVTKYAAKNHKLPQIILINVPRSQDTDCLSWQGIEEIKDMFFFSPKFQGGMICGAAPHVVIFSNQAPPMEKLSKDRWQIHRLSEQQLKSGALPGADFLDTKVLTAKSAKPFEDDSSMDEA